MAINVFEDITEHKESELRARFLADAATVLASSLDYETTLQQVAELAIPAFADGCIVELADSDGQLVPVAMAHRDRDKVALMRELREQNPAEPHATRGVGHVYRSGDSELYAQLDPGLLREGTPEDTQVEHARGARGPVADDRADEHRRPPARDDRVRAVRVRAPLRPRRPVGRRGARPGAPRSRSTTRASTASGATSRARSRRACCRPSFPRWRGPRSPRSFHPAGEAIEVGGDFYDVFDTSHGWSVVMGDVCGKGADAAAVTALARYTLRTLGVQETSPAEVLRKLNEALLRQRSDRRFCTVAYASLHVNGNGAADVCLSTGGHPLPYVLRADGTVEAVGEPGTLLGVLPEVSLSDTAVQLRRGDLMVLYTDGVTEARGPRRHVRRRPARRRCSPPAPGWMRNPSQRALNPLPWKYRRGTPETTSRFSW